jgi:shikimate kinase
MMGVGKSSVGRELAARLGRPFIDLDHTIEARAEKSIAHIFAEEGESRFRQIETETLADVCKDHDGAIIALGGGTLLQDKDRKATREIGPIICLDASPDTLAERVQNGVGRPLLNQESVGQSIDELLALRKTAYSDSDLTLATDGQTVTQVVDILCGQVRIGGYA